MRHAFGEDAERCGRDARAPGINGCALEAMELMLNKLKKNKTNIEFLLNMAVG